MRILLACLPVVLLSFPGLAQESKENPEFKLAVGLYKDGMFDLASEQFKNFIAAYPNTADGIEARYYLGLTQMKLKKFDEARITFQNFALAYVDHPKAPEAWFSVGEAFLALHNDREAASAFERVKVFHPKSALVPDALLRAAQLYRKLGERESAKQALRSIIQDYPTSKSVLAARLAVGELYAEEGQTNLAEQEARRVSESDAAPEVKAAALFALGKLQTTACLYEDAKKTFASVLAAYKDAPAAAASRFELGKLEGGSGHYASAVDAFKKVISGSDEGDTLQARAYFELGRTYQLSRDPALATASYEKAAESADSVLALRALEGAAECALDKNEFERALRFSERALRYAFPIPKRKAYVTAAMSLAQMGHDAEAAGYYESFTEAYPEDPWTPDILMSLAELSAHQDCRKAEAWLERIVVRYPRWRHVADAMEKIGDCEQSTGDFKGALSTYLDIAKRYPAYDGGPSIAAKGRYLVDHKIKDHEAGMDELARLMGEVLSDKSQPALPLKLGRIYFRDLKDYASARKQFDAAIAGGLTGNDRAEALYSKARCDDLLADSDSTMALSAISGYEAFLKEFPSSNLREEAAEYLYDLKRARSNLRERIELAGSMLQSQPASRYRDRYLFDLGWEDIAAGDTGRGMERLMQVITVFPGSGYAAEALLLRGKVFAGSLPDSALASWGQASVYVPPTRPALDALWLMASYRSAKQQPSEAAPLWKRLSDEFSYTARGESAAVKIAAAAISNGDYDQAISLLSKRLKKSETSPFPGPFDASPLFDLGDAYQKKGERQMAMKYFSEYLERNPTGPLAGRAFYSLGIIARTEGRMEAASTYFKEAGLLGGTVGASPEIADLLYQTEQYAEAARQYAQLAQSSDSAQAKEEYGAKVILATLRQGKLQEADKLITGFNESYGDDRSHAAEFQYERGLACYRKEDYQTAEKIFKKVAGDYGQTRFGPWGAYYRAKILEVTNKPNDAAKGYEEVLKKYPDSDVIPRVQLSLGNMHYNSERYEDAIRYYQKIAASPESAGDILPYALNNLIEAYESTKLYDAALKTARDFIARYPNDESILDKKIKIGTLYTKLGFYDQAILQFQNLIGEAGSLLEAELRYDIGEAYYNKGDYQQAILEFLKVPYLVSRQGKVNWTATSFYMAGQSYEKMSKFDEAIGMYRQVVERPGIDATFKAAAKKEIDRVKQIINKGPK